MNFKNVFPGLARRARPGRSIFGIHVATFTKWIFHIYHIKGVVVYGSGFKVQVLGLRVLEFESKPSGCLKKKIFRLPAAG